MTDLQMNFLVNHKGVKPTEYTIDTSVIESPMKLSTAIEILKWIKADSNVTQRGYCLDAFEVGPLEPNGRRDKGNTAPFFEEGTYNPIPNLADVVQINITNNQDRYVRDFRGTLPLMIFQYESQGEKYFAIREDSSWKVESSEADCLINMLRAIEESSKKTEETT